MAGSRERRVEPVDLVVAAAFALALQAQVWVPSLFGADAHLTQRPLLSLLGVAVAAPLVARRVAPWPAGLASLGASSLMGQAETPPEGLADLAAVLLVSYSLGRYARRPVGYVGVVPVLACAMAQGEDWADRSFVAVLLAAAWGVGVLVGQRSDDVVGLRQAHRESEQQRLVAAREGAADERHRIALELHDVVAHRVSMIVVQSQAADALLDGDPEGARRALRSVEEAARQALTELRQVVGAMHESEAPPPAAADLSHLASVVDDATRAGVTVSLETRGATRPVAPVVALAVSRIVQESLFNVARHADGAAATVCLVYGDHEVEVVVENDGPPVEAPAPGHGLSGMAERASFLGGALEAGPRSGGGFRVRAFIPTAGAAT